MGDKPTVKNLEVTQGQRLAYSRVMLDDIIKQGDAYREFIEGSAPDVATPGDEDDLSPQEQAERKAMGRGWRKTSIPAHGVLRQVLLPSLVSRPPAWVNRGRRKPRYEDMTPQEQEACELEKRRGTVYSTLADVIYRTGQTQQQILASVDDAMQYTVGWLEVDFDKERKLPRIRWQAADRVLVDMESDADPFGKNHRWRAVCWTMSHEDAKKKAKTVWNKPRYEFSPEKRTMLEADDDGFGNPTSQEAPTEYVRLVRVYVRGDSPFLDTANVGSDDQIEDVGKDDVYNGKNEILIMEAKGRWDDYGSYKLIARMDWPFPVDHDDFPLEPVKITHSNYNFYPYSIYQPGHSLQIALNWAMRYFNTDAYHSSRRIIGYMQGAFDKKTLEAALFSPDNLNAIEFKSQGDMERALKPLDFGQPSPTLDKAIGGNQVQYDKATGLDAFNLEARSHRTATDAAIQNEESQLRVGAMADRVEEAITNAMRKALMCARKLMTAEEVAAHIGPELLKFKTSLDEKGNEVRISEIWDDTIDDTESIRAEVDIHIEPRSVRFVSPEQELNDMDRLAAVQDKLLLTIGKINESNPVLAESYARAYNAMMKAYVERMHIINGDEFLIDLRAAITPPIPQQPMGQPGMPPGGGAPQGGGPQGPVTTQLSAATQELGLNPANLPGQLADQVARAQ